MTSHTFCPSVWSNFTEGSRCGRPPRGREPVLSRLCEVFSAALEPRASLCDTAAQRLHSGVTQLHILTVKDPLKATVLVAQCLSWLKGTMCPFHRKSHAGCDCIWTERRDFLHRRTSSVHVTPGIKHNKYQPKNNASAAQSSERMQRMRGEIIQHGQKITPSSALPCHQ